MSVSTFLWSICVFWAVLYAIRASCTSKSTGDLLPTSAEQHRSIRAGSRQWKVTVKNVHLKVQTSALNARHEALVDFFDRQANFVYRNALRIFYNLGSVFGVLGMLLGIAVLACTCFQLLESTFFTDDDTSGHTIAKRSDLNPDSAVTVQSSYALNPIIPGVTVPFSHLSVLLAALFVAQCIHEAGHAYAASIESLSLHAVGASITLVLPSAFVSLSPSISMLSASAKMRIVAAGAWHNLLLWGALYLATFAGAGRLWRVVGWRDVREMGLVVLGVEEGSPLIHHLPPGSVVASLDDVILGGQDVDQDAVWSRFLLSGQSRHTPYEQGWCIEASYFFEQSTDCCTAYGDMDPPHPPAAQRSCFVLAQERDNGHCIDPIPILTPSFSVMKDDDARCYSSSDCHKRAAGEGESQVDAASRICVRPDNSAQLLRITVLSPVWERHDQSSRKTVLWNGPREEIWEQVTVDTLSPRFRFLPLWLPRVTSLFFEYLSTLSFSLYIFNLFALPFLDGSHFLSALLDYIGTTRELPQGTERGYDDIELGIQEDGLGPRGPGSNTTGPPVRFSRPPSSGLGIPFVRRCRLGVRRHKAGIERVVRYVTIALMCASIIGMASQTR
ncbi:hypothetical protein M0805_007973 [Coniferiporia weirii]|nr:hypothetical protein M0805_007973 [Coniferiporia weirii]